MRGNLWMLLSAFALLAVAVVIGVRTFGGTPAPPVRAALRDRGVQAPSGYHAGARPTREPRRAGPPPAPPAAAVAAQPDADDEPGRAELDPDTVEAYLAAAQAAAREAQAQGKALEGIWAMPPHGTKPLLEGIVVPDDFELPPGYVRHYQSTDDGRPLPPILMYDPDRVMLDEDGQPVNDDTARVVPASEAPAGLPVELLEIPEPDPSRVQGGARRVR